VIGATELRSTFLFAGPSTIADSVQFTSSSEIVTSLQLHKTDRLTGSAEIMMTDALLQSSLNIASSQINITAAMLTNMFRKSAEFIPSAGGRTFLFL
jgi:hypothetical protein